MRRFGSGSECVGRRAHSAAVARGAVEAVRAARNVPGHCAGSAFHVEATVAGGRRRAGRHSRGAVRCARILDCLLHLEAAVSRGSRHWVFFDFEACKVVVLETLRESGTAVRRWDISANGKRVAQDGSGTAIASVCSLCIGMVAARVFCEGGLATERFVAALYE